MILKSGAIKNNSSVHLLKIVRPCGNIHSHTKYTDHGKHGIMHTVYFIFTSKYNTMLPAPNGSARLRPGDRIWIDLISSSEESDDDDNAAGDNARQQPAGGADNERRQRGPPPQVDLNPYAPAENGGRVEPQPRSPPRGPPPRGPSPHHPHSHKT